MVQSRRAAIRFDGQGFPVAGGAAPCAGRGFPSSVEALAQRTLGQGLPEADRLKTPAPQSAVFIWQGTLERPGHTARLRVPVPREWLNEAQKPRLRTVCAWNTPVIAGAPAVWGCRRVGLQLRSMLGGKTAIARGSVPGVYPIVDRIYDLGDERRRHQGIEVASDEWVLELDYQLAGPYPPNVVIDDKQRVSVALELFDAGDRPASPQAAVQSHALAATMVRLGSTEQPIWSPIKIPAT